MTHHVRLSAEAEQDIKQAYLYIAEHGPANPDQWKAGLLEHLTSLESFPRRCGLAPESQDSGDLIYQTIYTSYRILFVIEEQTVLVFACWHGSRLPLSSDELDERL